MHFFQTWLNKNTKYSVEHATFNVEKITEEMIREYRLYLSRDYMNPYKGELKKQTQNYFLVALRSFFRFLIKKGHKTISPESIDLGKVIDREIKPPTTDDVKDLLDAPDTSKIQGVRDRAILELLFSTGLRVSELVSLNIDKINLQSKEFSVIGKGGKARVVFVSNTAAEWVKRYIDMRADPYKSLFIRYSGPKADTLDDKNFRLTSRSIERMVDKYKKIAGITGHLSPHSLRHSFATDLLRAGADIRSVQLMLGHKNLSTTQVYTHLTDTHLREIHKKFHSGNK